MGVANADKRYRYVAHCAAFAFGDLQAGDARVEQSSATNLAFLAFVGTFASASAIVSAASHDLVDGDTARASVADAEDAVVVFSAADAEVMSAVGAAFGVVVGDDPASGVHYNQATLAVAGR